MCRPSDYTVGRPRAEMRTQDGQSRGRDSITTRPPHLLVVTRLTGYLSGPAALTALATVCKAAV